VVFYWHFDIFLNYLDIPLTNDIPARTLTAARTLLTGNNPYKLSIPPLEAIRSSNIYQEGFVYMPFMMLVYIPLIWLGAKGVLITNLLLEIAAIILLWLIGKKIASGVVGLLAVFLYLMTWLVPYELFGSGVTDLAAIVPLLVAVFLFPMSPLNNPFSSRNLPGLRSKIRKMRRNNNHYFDEFYGFLSQVQGNYSRKGGYLTGSRQMGWVGFFIGLSIAVKLLPGALFIIAFFNKSHWRKYLLGIGFGLIPFWFFLILSPGDFLAGTVLFALIRPGDETSWLYGVSPLIKNSVQILLLLAVLGSTVYVWRKPVLIRMRLGIALMLILGLLLASVVNHRNYQLWWIPFYALLTALAALGNTSQLNSNVAPRPQ